MTRLSSAITVGYAIRKNKFKPKTRNTNESEIQNSAF